MVVVAAAAAAAAAAAPTSGIVAAVVEQEGGMQVTSANMQAPVSSWLAACWLPAEVLHLKDDAPLP